MLKKTQGFTLVELMTVVAILGIMAAIFLPVIYGVHSCAEPGDTLVEAGTNTKVIVRKSKYVDYEGCLVMVIYPDSSVTDYQNQDRFDSPSHLK